MGGGQSWGLPGGGRGQAGLGQREVWASPEVKQAPRAGGRSGGLSSLGWPGACVSTQRPAPHLVHMRRDARIDAPAHIALLLVPGEKLDYKTCEALEEVFKRLQFKVVDLEQTNLDEDVSSPPPPIPTP